LLNVATPLAAVAVVVPPTPVGVEVTVIEAFDVVIGLPVASWTCTTTAVMAEPAVPFTGCVVNTSFVACPMAEVTWAVEQLVLAKLIPETLVPLNDTK
jgi:hypothetical protein